MNHKTTIKAQAGRQDILITRTFDLPLALLFRAHTEAQLVEQWMNTKVLKLENKPHGSWQYETTDAKGNRHGFNGVIHAFSPNQKITRTFEMENTPFPVQLEFLEFEPLTDHTSQLTMHIVYRSVADRDQMLKLPFAQGLNGAHDRLQDLISHLH